MNLIKLKKFATSPHDHTYRATPCRKYTNDNKIYSIIGASLSEPHIDELHVRNLYIIIIYYDNIWYVRHPRAAVYNVQQLAIYSGGRMKKLLRSPVPRA